MPASTQRPPKHVLRSLLRLLETPRLPDHLARKAASAAAAVSNHHHHHHQSRTSKPYNNVSQAFAKQLYRQHIDKNSNNIADQQRQATAFTLAQNYLQLQQDLAERARLYELDTGAEQVLTAKEMSRRAAARAGLALPKLDPLLSPEDEDESK